MDTLEDGELLEEGEIIEDDDNGGNNQADYTERHKGESGDTNNHHYNFNNNNNNNNHHHHHHHHHHQNAATSEGATNGKENMVRRYKDGGGIKHPRDEHNTAGTAAATSNNKKKRKQKQQNGNYGNSRKRKAEERLLPPPPMKHGKHPKFKVALNGTSGKGTLDILDITQWLLDDSFDEVVLPDEQEYNLDSIDFDTLLDTLGCSAPTFQFDTVTEASERKRLLFRIVKIMRHITDGSDMLRERRFARLKRRMHADGDSSASPPQQPSNNHVAKSPPPSQNAKSSNVAAGGASAAVTAHINNGKPFRKQKCKFYLEGKCHKGDDCTYSHDFAVPKRKDLCKFYKQGFCGKGDACTFMHGEFPCKFFHTNTECFQAEKCLYSHAPLTEETRAILRNYLDSGTLPDDPKPFRPAPPSATASAGGRSQGARQISPPMEEYGGDWAGKSPRDDEDDRNYEALLARPRPTLIKKRPPKVDSSYETWKWQQNLRDLQKDYKGMKKNLFQIDDSLKMTKEPALEDNEEEVEAMISEYLKDTLHENPDDYFEQVAAHEIKEHWKVNQKLPPRALPCTSAESYDYHNPPHELMKMAEEEEQKRFLEERAFREERQLEEERRLIEEKRLLEASAHDEDMRFRPHVMPMVGPFAQVFQPPPTEEREPARPSLLEHPMVADVDNMLRQVRSASSKAHNVPPPLSINVTPSSSSSSSSSPPQTKDPRLNRVKATAPGAGNKAPCLSPSATSVQSPLPVFPPLFGDTQAKTYFKVCNPNVHIEYRAISVAASKIDYSCFYELYQNETSPLRTDPRLVQFFNLFPKPRDFDLRARAAAQVEISAEDTKPFPMANFNKPSISEKLPAAFAPLRSSMSPPSALPSPSSSSSSSSAPVRVDPRRDPRMARKAKPIELKDKVDKTSIDSMDSNSLGETSSSSSDVTISTTNNNTTTPSTTFSTISNPVPPAMPIPSYAQSSQPSIFAIDPLSSGLGVLSTSSLDSKVSLTSSLHTKSLADWKEPSTTDLVDDDDEEEDTMHIDLAHSPLDNGTIVDDSDDEDKLVIATESEDNKDSDTMSNESFSILQ